MQPKNEEARKAVATAIPSLKRKNVPINVSNPTAAQRQERNLDEILTCWRWARSLDHQLDVYQLQFEHDVAGALSTDHYALANEIGSFRAVAQTLGAA